MGDLKYSCQQITQFSEILAVTTLQPRLLVEMAKGSVDREVFVRMVFQKLKNAFIFAEILLFIQV